MRMRVIVVSSLRRGRLVQEDGEILPGNAVGEWSEVMG